MTASSSDLNPEVFEAFRTPAFRRMWPAALFGYIGGSMEMTITSWLVLQLTNSPEKVSFLGVSRLAPTLILGLFLGSLADRYSRRNLILISQALVTLFAALMLFRLSVNAVDAWFVIVQVLFVGVSSTLLFSSWRSYCSDVFSPSQLANAMSLDVVAFRAARMIGPLLGGGLIALVGYAWTYALITTLYLGAFLLMHTVHGDGSYVPRKSAATTKTHMGDAFRVIASNRALGAILLLTLVMNLFGFPYEEMVSVFARDVLRVGSTLYGLLGAGAGLASLLGSLAIASRRVRRQRTLFSLGAVLTMLALVPFALSSRYWASFLLLSLSGLAGAGFDTMQFTILLQAVPPEIRGRMMGITTLAIGMMPVGILALGQLTEALGPQMALALMEGTGVLAALLLLGYFPELLDRT